MSARYSLHNLFRPGQKRRSAPTTEGGGANSTPCWDLTANKHQVTVKHADLSFYQVIQRFKTMTTHTCIHGLNHQHRCLVNSLHVPVQGTFKKRVLPPMNGIQNIRIDKLRMGRENTYGITHFPAVLTFYIAGKKVSFLFFMLGVF